MRKLTILSFVSVYDLILHSMYLMQFQERNVTFTIKQYLVLLWNIVGKRSKQCFQIHQIFFTQTLGDLNDLALI